MNFVNIALPVKPNLPITLPVVQLFLFNHENSWSIERQKQNRTWDTFAHIEKYYRTLKSFGAPVDFISEAKNLSDYPVVIAPTYQLAE